jgi:hypothetical protein
LFLHVFKQKLCLLAVAMLILAAPQVHAPVIRFATAPGPEKQKLHHGGTETRRKQKEIRFDWYIAFLASGKRFVPDQAAILASKSPDGRS